MTGTQFIQSTDGLFLYHHRLAGYKWLRHGFSLRRSRDLGELSYGLNDYQPREQILENRHRLVRAIFTCDLRLVLLQQTHSNIVLADSGFDLSAVPPQGDGIALTQSQVAVAVQTADCVPIILVDPVQRAVAALHGGWRGLLGDIIRNGLDVLREKKSSDPRNCIAVIGPCIRGCCFEIGADLAQVFHQRFAHRTAVFCDAPKRTHTRDGSRFLDLAQVCRTQLMDQGLSPENIWEDSPCTFCRNDLFFSHRGDGSRTGRMLAVVGLL